MHSINPKTKAKLLNVFTKKGFNRAWVEEALNDVEMQLFDMDVTYKDAYYSKSVYYTLLNKARRESYYVGLEYNTNEICPGPSVLEALISKERTDYLEQLISTLPPNQRQVINLMYKKGLTVPEIAGMLGRKYETVKSQYRTGMLKLRGLYELSEFQGT